MLFFVIACKKKHEPAAAPCTAVLYGYSVPSLTTSPFGDTLEICTFGTIDTATATCSSIATINNGKQNKQGIYNTSDNCYYVLQAPNWIGQPIYHITGSGSVALLHPDSLSSGYRPGAHIYNKANSKMYCFYIESTDNSCKLGEILTSGSTYSITPVASTQHYLAVYSSTVDENTGDIYYLLGDTSTVFLEKYDMGSAIVSTIDSISVSVLRNVFGLQFNTNDNKLYAINSNYSASSSSLPSTLLKINPSGGYTTIGTLGFTIDPIIQSTAFDQCNNHYILSGRTGSGINVLTRFNTSGAMVGYHSTTGILMGLALKY